MSRKDGSIIKVAGSLEEESEHLSNGTSLDTDSPTQAIASPTHAISDGVAISTIEDRDADDEAMVTNVKAGPTRAEKLASDIFHFVTAASALSSSLQSTTISKESDESYKNDIGYQQLQEETLTAKVERESGSSGVQLLRMRSKKHEIVIFPDPNFLCCVVQNMDRLNR